MRTLTPAYTIGPASDGTPREAFVKIGAVFLSPDVYARGSRLHIFSHAVADESIDRDKCADGSMHIYNAMIHNGMISKDDKAVVINWFKTTEPHIQVVHVDHASFRHGRGISSQGLLEMYRRMLAREIDGLERNKHEAFFAQLVDGAYTAFEHHFFTDEELARACTLVPTYFGEETVVQFGSFHTIKSL